MGIRDEIVRVMKLEGQTLARLYESVGGGITSKRFS